VNGYLARASGPFATIRAQRLIDATPGLSSQQNPKGQNDRAANAEAHTNDQTHDNLRILALESNAYAEKFANFAGMAQLPELTKNFDKPVSEFLVFLFEANKQLPGTQHPAVTYYQKRKQGRENNMNRRHKDSSNPRRASKRQ